MMLQRTRLPLTQGILSLMPSMSWLYPNSKATPLLTRHLQIRRLIGRRFDDPSVKKDTQSWPFRVIDKDGNPQIEVEYLGETKQFSPQEISAMVLVKVGDRFHLILVVYYVFITTVCDV